MAIYNGTKVLSVVKTERVLVDSASEVSYDNNESGLEATSVQGAIDELNKTRVNLFEEEENYIPYFYEKDGKLYLRPSGLTSNLTRQVINLRNVADTSDLSNVSMNPWGINAESGVGDKSSITPWNITNENGDYKSSITANNVKVSQTNYSSILTSKDLTIEDTKNNESAIYKKNGISHIATGILTTLLFPSFNSHGTHTIGTTDQINDAVHMYYEYHNSSLIYLEDCLITYISSNKEGEKLSIANATIAGTSEAVPSAEWYIIMLPSKLFTPSDGTQAKWTGIVIHPTTISISSKQINLVDDEQVLAIQTGTSGASQWSLKKKLA